MNTSTDIPKRSRSHHIREATVSGFFYPSTAQELSGKIDSLLREADTPNNNFSAIVCPHGSLDYSGAIAAKAWKACSGREIGTIVILSPSHRSFEPGIFMPEAHYFEVPTGQFKVDRAIVKALLHSTTNLRLSDIPHFEEHSIEMQLIFAAQLFPETLILPIIVSGADDQAMDTLFSNLQFVLGDRLASTLIVLTTNLAVDENADHCLEVSASFVEAIQKRQIALVQTFCEAAPSFCGGRIIAGYLRSNLSSGMDAEVFGMGSSVAFAEQGEPIVGYASIGFTR